MIWFLPRSDPGAATEYRRPNGCGVSTESGALLPHGRLPRLLMLWMYVERAMPVIEASLTRWAGEDDPFREVAPLCATQVELSEALGEEMRRRRVRLCPHTVRAVQHSPFELDVYLWERCYRTHDLHEALPAHSCLARYHALAEHPVPRPSPAEVCAFEDEFQKTRSRLVQLREEVAPSGEFDDDIPF